ncbi:MAG TPA: phosphoenolpyruvate mutase [Gammaproteobacteria bacterium]|nr:phosphoenolpyruvate mutase [Gammaproteobacteria bacterium]
MNKPDSTNIPGVNIGTRASRLRSILQSPQLEFLMEAHNGISARIAEESGFAGIWASGLALSAQFGVRDNNEASWTQVVDMLEFMSDVTTVPILLDGDTGYGNFNNTRRLVRKLEQRSIAGVCIEDKLFPKSNSFLDSERQPLADIDEFCGKIKAGKDSQDNDNFCIVARVEALIAGWDMKEALRRAEAYRQAGADAILIHSKLGRPDEVLVFAREWANRAPLVIVPTTYYSTPVETFRRAQISVVIWANHLIRASVAAMQAAARQIRASQSPIDVEDRIATVNEIFRLQAAEELKKAEQRYAAAGQHRVQAIVLAASRGRELDGLTEARPKVMLPIGGRPLLRRLVDEFKKQGINEITVVAGYRAETIDVPGIEVTVNKDYERTGELASLACAQPDFSDNMVILYGDLLFRSYILRDLLDSNGEITVVVDSAAATPATGSPDYARCSLPDDRTVMDREVQLLQLTKEARGSSGRWIGMVRVRGEGLRWLNDSLATLMTREKEQQLGLPDVLNHIIAQGHPVRVLYINGHWLDVNSLDDLDRASDFT